MKVLVTGVAGQLGYDACQEFKERRIPYVGTDVTDCDITDAEAVNALFEREKPDAVIHCAAFSQVDEAEKNARHCHTVNVQGTRYIADLCQEQGSYLVYISTDYVFDGSKQGEYEISDLKNPLSVYGKTKSEGEDIVLAASRNNMVLRTSWLFGRNCGRHGNFVESILCAGRSHPEVKVVDDQVGSPTYSADLARLLVEILEKRPSGILHGTNEGYCSRAEFAKEILRQAGVSSRVVGVTSGQYPSSARRPLNSRLSKQSLDDVGLSHLPAWQDGLAHYLKEQGFGG